MQNESRVQVPLMVRGRWDAQNKMTEDSESDN